MQELNVSSQPIYSIALNDDILTLGFGSPAQNNEIVPFVARELKKMKVLKGGKVLKINGPASLPVAVVIAHHVGHLYGAIAVFDPKLGKYVVSISHSRDYAIGDLID